MIDAVIKDLNEVANPSRRKTLMKQGASESAIGVPLGFLRTYAKGLSGHPSLATELWKTQIVDAQLLAVMIMDANGLSIDAIMDMIQEASTDALLDDFIFRTLVSYQDKEGLKQALLSKDEDVFGKVYWGLVVFELKKKPVDATLAKMILEHASQELQSALPLTQWMLNRALSELGFRHPEYTQDCLDLGEQLGVYKDMVVAKGCTSAYAPAWINAIINK